MSDAYIPFGGGTSEAPDGVEQSSGPVAPSAAPNFLGGSSGDGSGEQFDATIHAGPDKRNADGSYRRKRGRKSGSGNSGNSKAQNSVGIDALTNMLAIVHLGLASIARTPELKLTDDEARSLAEATATVLTEFDIRPDPKITAIVGLVTTAGVIYTPKVYFMRERWKEEAKAQAEENVAA